MSSGVLLIQAMEVFPESIGKSGYKGEN